MSAIASFYVVPDERLSDIAAAATPTQGGWLRRARDTFGDVLRGVARQLDDFPWSGWAFNTLDLYLDDRHGFLYGKFGDEAASEKLTKARGSYCLVLPAPSAADLLARLNTVKCELADLTSFITDEHGSEEAAEEAVAVQAAFAAMKSWLAEVSAGSIGLLLVG